MLNSLIVLAAGAIPSALIEAAIWQRFAAPETKKTALGNSFAIHLVGIPIALAILLIPEHPYRGFEATAIGARNRILRGKVTSALEEYVKAKGKFPKASSTQELTSALHLEEAELAFFHPSYRRFSMKDERDKPWRFNANVSEKPIKNSDKPNWIPIAESVDRPGWALFMNFSSGDVHLGRNPGDFK